MRSKARTVLLLAALVASSPGAWSDGAEGEAWTLARCGREALSSSHRLAAAAREVGRAEAAAREADAVRLPAFELGGAYAYTSETMSLDLPTLGPFDLPGIRFGDGNMYDLRLQISAPLFTGGALRSRARAEEASVRAARHDLAADSLGLIREVRRSFFAALGAEARAEAARVAEGRLRRHLEDLEAAIRVGTASEENRVEALVHLRQAERIRVGAEGHARIERLALGNLVGLPGLAVEPAADLEAPLLDSGTPLDLHPARRPEVVALGERAERSAHLARAARAAYYPTLAAQAAYHRAKPGVDVIENDWMQYGTVALTVSWPLWDWGARRERVLQAKEARASLEEHRMELEQSLRAGLEAARARLESARSEAAKAGERAELEKRRLQFVTNRYREGAASESELLDAEDDLAASEIDRVVATAAVRLAESELLYLLGR